MKLVSIIIILDKISPDLFSLVYQIRKQTSKIASLKFEVLLVHESNETLMPLKRVSGCKYITIPAKRGFAFNRNQGLKHSNGGIIIFIDDDCLPENNWLVNLLHPFKDPEVMAVMGNVKIPKSNYLGDCIAELGFPAGGNAGFDRIWKVTRDGFTNHLTTCNCALRREIFSEIGLFNERLVYGTEDAELSYRMEKANQFIKYNPKALAYHKPKDSLSAFVKWQLRRGRANYHFKREVDTIGDFIKLRVWSSYNIIRKNIFNLKLFCIVLLLFLSCLLQQWGYIDEASMQKK